MEALRFLSLRERGGRLLEKSSGHPVQAGARLLASGLDLFPAFPVRPGGCWEIVSGYSGATASDFHGLPFASTWRPPHPRQATCLKRRARYHKPRVRVKPEKWGSKKFFPYTERLFHETRYKNADDAD